MLFHVESVIDYKLGVDLFIQIFTCVSFLFRHTVKKIKVILEVIDFKNDYKYSLYIHFNFIVIRNILFYYS